MHIYLFYKNGTDDFKSYIYLFQTQPALRAILVILTTSWTLKIECNNFFIKVKVNKLFLNFYCKYIFKLLITTFVLCFLILVGYFREK